MSSAAMARRAARRTASIACMSTAALCLAGHAGDIASAAWRQCLSQFAGSGIFHTNEYYTPEIFICIYVVLPETQQMQWAWPDAATANRTARRRSAAAFS
jgi:hypothetical protein